MHLSLHWIAFFVIPLKMPRVHLKVKKELHNEIFFELQAISYWLNSGDQQKLMHYCNFL